MFFSNLLDKVKQRKIKKEEMIRSYYSLNYLRFPALHAEYVISDEKPVPETRLKY